MIIRSRTRSLQAIQRNLSVSVSAANRLTRHRVPPRVAARPNPASPNEELVRQQRESIPPDAAHPTSTSTLPNGTFAWNSYNELPAETSSSAIADSAIQTPIQVPHDEHGIIDNAKDEPWAERARKLFGSVPALVVVRQLELANVLIGYEEANRYRLCAPDGSLLGYLVEQETGFRGAMARQMVGTHRAFRATVLDPEGNVILTIRRPFSWINSRIFVCAPSETGRDEDEVVIGEVQQEWHLYRRKYNHFIKRDGEMVQFASTDAGLLAWNFFATNERGEPIASVNRNFTGLARELFTDTGQYVLRFEGVLDELADPRIESPPVPALPPSSANTDSSEDGSSNVPALIAPSITYDQRAVLLASAVSIDFDYFTRSRGGFAPPFGMFMPIPMPGGGGAGAPAETEAGIDAGASDASPAVGGGAPGPGTLDDPTLDQDGRLPPTSERDWRREETGNGEYDPWSASNEAAGTNEGWAGNDDEVMRDPWSNAGDVQEQEGGTWGWSDLFPGDDE